MVRTAMAAGCSGSSEISGVWRSQQQASGARPGRAWRPTHPAIGVRCPGLEILDTAVEMQSGIAV